MSIVSTIPVFVLNNSLALNEIFRNLRTEAKRPMHLAHMNGTTEEWRLWAYTGAFFHDSSRPDHVFDFRWKKFMSGHDRIDLTEALQIVGESYLEIHNHRLYIRKGDAFSRWQNIRARMSTLPIKIQFLQRHNMSPSADLAHPYSPAVESLILEDGLHETHLHLNGYLYPEESWLHDLYDISSFLREEEKQYQRSPALREYYKTVNPELTPQRLCGRLKLAAALRDTLLCMLTANEKQQQVQVKEMLDFLFTYAQLPNFTQTKPRMQEIPRFYPERLRQEQDMWYRAFQFLKGHSRCRCIFEQFLHLYLLLENEYISLYRHNEQNSGFAAFAKASDHERRAVSVSTGYYHTTFRRLLKAAEATGHTHLEIRITPKAFIEKGTQLCRIWEDCCRNHPKGRQTTGAGSAPIQMPQLIFVTHFIKRKPKEHQANSLILSDLYEKEREKHLQTAADLANFYQQFSQQHRYPLGIDAAASELDLPPEVFAPAFRLFERRTHISHKTYHCGEDFHHLLSGIRAIHEAVTFLGLTTGNRIGHGTAIGISPSLWLESMPEKIILERGEWMLDLIFAARYLRTDKQDYARRVALDLAHCIFNRSVSLHDLDALYDARAFVPRHVRELIKCEGPRACPIPISDDTKEEYKLIRSFIDAHGTAWSELHNAWFTDKSTREKMTELVEIAQDEITAKELLCLQQRVQALIADRDIAIETPPISNLRISQYRQVEQHHILRWLGVPGYTCEGDVPMNICMGSDDPGIFVTDIKNEYYHLYNLLRKTGRTQQEAIDKMKQVNHNGRIYAFHTLPPEQEQWMPSYRKNHAPFFE